MPAERVAATSSRSRAAATVTTPVEREGEVIRARRPKNKSPALDSPRQDQGERLPDGGLLERRDA
jgi:hypothetical protein